jgi:hypothetical protein
MPGMKLLTPFDPHMCLRAAWRAAQDLGYSLTPAIEHCTSRFKATKGSAILSVLPLMPPQCVFEVSVVTYPDGNEVIVERNEPWLTSGKIGVGRVKRQAEELANAIACAIEKTGGKIQEQKEF